VKVLHVVTSIDGGAGKCALRLHKGLLERGIESVILCRSLEDHESRIYSEYSHKRSLFKRVLVYLSVCKSHEKSNLLMKKNQTNYYDYFSFCEADLDITETKLYKSADVVNLHWTGNFLDYPSFFRKNNKPLVWSLTDLNPFTGGCHYSNSCLKFIDDECDICPQLQGTINPSNSHLNFVKKKKALSRTKFKPVVVPPAKWLFNLSRKSELFGKFKHSIIPHSSDEEVYKTLNKEDCKRSFNLPKNKIIFLFSASALSDLRKGFALLTAALQLINIENIHFLILGKKDIDIPITISDYTATGYLLDEAMISKAFNASDAVIVPSLEDNLPLTMIDSLMCGTPVISFDKGGMSTHIKNGFNGYKASALTAESLSKSILKFVEEKEKLNRKEISQAANLLYSKDVHCQQYIELYKNLIK